MFVTVLAVAADRRGRMGYRAVGHVVQVQPVQVCFTSVWRPRVQVQPLSDVALINRAST
jgi:hypothetical protein